MVNMKRVLLAAVTLLSFSPFAVSAASMDKFDIVCVPIVEENDAHRDFKQAVGSRTFVMFADKKSSVEIFTDGNKVEYRKWVLTEFQDEFLVMVNSKEAPTHKININRLNGIAESFGIPVKTENPTPLPEGLVRIPSFKLIEVYRCRKAEPIF